MRATVRSYPLAACVAALGLLTAACSDGGGARAADRGQEVHLQPVAAAGPDPFTASTATSAVALPSGTGGTSGTADVEPTDSGGAPTLRTVNGAVPGLYGGTHKLGSCDVEQQVAFLAAEQARARAFSRAAGVAQAELPDFLRGLTPVVLRADTRVTNHGFRDGRATSFQSVLQAGTAVLVDEHGLPRVRCACGNPLMPPAAVEGKQLHQGAPWPGYQPHQVVVIKPTTQAVTNLVIVNITDNTWIERTTGDDGAQDRRPAVPPAHDPTGPIPSDAPASPDTGSGDPCATPSSTPTPPLSATPRADDGTAAEPPAARPTDCPPLTPPPAVVSPDTTVPDRSSPAEPLPSLPDTGTTPGDVPSDLPVETPPGDPFTEEVPVQPDGSTGDPYDPYGVDPYAPSDPYAPYDPYGGTGDTQAPDPDAYLENA
ncbi:DUF6777 domain-containing protein [Streptomyces sp. NPDC101132]|uniref:DUF6777 domain-containing protein n=1 Tax=Streptomyces sp. NPDC101132 TaxID=3366110 RepID=UPI0038086908